MTELTLSFPARRRLFPWIATLALVAAAGGVFPRPAAAQFTEYPSPSSGPNGIAIVGIYPDDPFLVITETSANKIAGIGYDGSVVGEVTVPTAASQPWGIVLGPDADIWFTELAGDQIGTITTGSTIVEYPIPTAGSHPWGIAAGPDGALWFTESGGNKIGRITVAGVITEFPIPTASSAPQGIVAGPDGAMWFVEFGGNNVGRITMAGVITEFPIPTAAAGPWMIASSLDGNLWFTEHTANQIGRITPAGVVTEFPVPTPASGPFGIAPGRQSVLFFTEENAGQGAVISPTGEINEFPLPTSSSGARGVVVGEDSEVWFTESLANKIARGDPRDISAQALVAMTFGLDNNLWFTEASDKIGQRYVGGGGFHEYSTPTAGTLGGITLGPLGFLWFAETGASKIGRSDYGGNITEFPVPSPPAGVTLGPDGNLWFTEPSANKIGMMTPAGAVTEFAVPTAASGPTDITTTGNGKIWFTEKLADKFATITLAGVVTEYPLPATGCGLSDLAFSNGTLWSACSSLASELRSIPQGGGAVTPWVVLGNAKHVAAGTNRNIWYAGDSQFIGQFRVVEGDGALYPLPDAGGSPSVKCLTAGFGGRMEYGMSGAVGGPWVGEFNLPMTATECVVDAAGNGVFDPGETVTVSTAWRNWHPTTPMQAKITSFVGPAGATYTVDDGNADFGVIANGSAEGCARTTGNCYQLTIDNPAVRPAQHWDASFTEDFTLGGYEQRRRPLHIGGSFGDVPPTAGFYRFAETLFHFGITAGCGGGNYCPASNNTRAQMAVFLLVTAKPAGYTPPPCTSPVFADVPCSSGFAPWVNELAAEGVTAGCGGGNYCPNNPVTRAQMAVFLLRTAEGLAYTPPACVLPSFADVPCTSGFAVWVNELARRGITAGCGGGNYCPGNSVTRGQMAVFLTTTFGLTLYGP